MVIDVRDELVFSRAIPGRECWLIAIFGPSGSGKTFSAHRLARGLAGPNGRVGMADTENRRGLFYAEDFIFDHAEIHDPYRPEKYTRAVELSRNAGHDVLIIDSMSHEWLSLLEWHGLELNRMAGRDYAKRERATFAAWIEPKAAHKQMMVKLLALNVHVIFCLRADIKHEMQKNENGKVVPVNVGFRAVCGHDFMYDMTVSIELTAEAPGVVKLGKINHKHRGLFRERELLDEATGERIAAYARGERIIIGDAPALPSVVTPPDVRTENEAAPARREDIPNDKPSPSEFATILLGRFNGVRTRAELDLLMQDPELFEFIAWAEAKKPALAVKVKTGMDRAHERTSPIPAQQDTLV